MKKILFIEDNEEYRDLLKQVLEDEGYIVDAVNDALVALQYFTLNRYDLIITDLKMQTLDGLGFLKHIKKEEPFMKTMILTGFPSLESEMESLDILVDQYITKDTRMELILKYIETLLQKNNAFALKNQTYTVKKEGIIVDVDAFCVTKNNKEIKFSPKEFAILCFLLSKKGRAISREEFLEKLWDTHYELLDGRVIDMHIKSIRRKLQTQSILSIRGYGYKWDI